MRAVFQTAAFSPGKSVEVSVKPDDDLPRQGPRRGCPSTAVTEAKTARCGVRSAYDRRARSRATYSVVLLTVGDEAATVIATT
jgi:hypothetical protein